MASAPAWPAEWSAEGEGSLKEEYNDNYRLTPLPHNATWMTTFSPVLTLAHKNETLTFSGGAGLNITRFSNDEGQNSVNPTLFLVSRYMRERDTFGLDLSYLRDSTLASELTTTGVVLVRAQRGSVSVSPSWSRSLSEKTSLKFDYNLTSVSYDNTTGTGLFDFRNQSASASVVHSISSVDQLNLTFSYSDYRTFPDSSKSQSYSLQTGVDRSFSETLTGSLSFGLTNTATQSQRNAMFCPVAVLLCQSGIVPLKTLVSATETHAHTYLFNGSVQKRFNETGTGALHISRTISPSGGGTLVETDSAGLGLSNRLTQNVTGFLDVNVYRTKSFGAALATSASTLYFVEPRLSWRLDRWWRLDTSVRHTGAEYGPQGRTSANSVYVLLKYTWPKLAASR